MQWQHGSYVIGSDGSITMTPIAVDGRQLLSQPCQSSHSTYTRYNTTEKMKACQTSPLRTLRNNKTNQKKRHTASTPTPTTTFPAWTSPSSTARSCSQCTLSTLLPKCCPPKLSTLPLTLPVPQPPQPPKQSATSLERYPRISRLVFRARS